MRRPVIVPCIVLLSFVMGQPSGAELPERALLTLAAGNAPALAVRHRVPLSAAYERMLRDQIAAGRRLDPAIVERFGLDGIESEFESAPADAASAERFDLLGTGCGARTGRSR